MLSWLAALSYSFYLWHQMLAVFLKYDLHLPAWSGDTPPNQLGDTVWMQQAEALYWLAALAVSIAATISLKSPLRGISRKLRKKCTLKKPDKRQNPAAGACFLRQSMVYS